MVLNDFEDITNIFYINLEQRRDRLEHILTQLELMGMKEKAVRFNAIKMIDGAIGCSMSHLNVLNDAIENKLDHVLVMEDDITFIEPQTFKTQFNKFILKHEANWDVILFAGNIREYDDVDETCIKAKKCGTTTGYLVNGHYIRTLRDNIKKGLNYLMRRPLYSNLYAIDVFWVGLQPKDKWYLIIPLTVVQMENYSDIEKRVTNYTQAMRKYI